MGMALSLIRGNYAQGEWDSWLATVQINKTRASKARAIYNSFSTIEALGNLSIEEAYARRRQSAASIRQASQAVKDQKTPREDEWFPCDRRPRNLGAASPTRLMFGLPTPAGTWRSLKTSRHNWTACGKRFANELVALQAVGETSGK